MEDRIDSTETDSRKFRNGLPLQSLINDLNSGTVDPMKTEYLIIRVAKQEGTGGMPRYFAFDHRRLYCFLQAGVRRFRVRVMLKGWQFNEFARKCDNFNTVTNLRVRGPF